MFKNNFCCGWVIAVVLLSFAISANAETAVSDINAKIAQLNIDTAGFNDVVRIFGEPISYTWGNEIFKKDNLPATYIAHYPNGFGVMIKNGVIAELRHEGPDGYLFRGKLKVGSSLDEVLEVVGRPKEILEGKQNEFKDNTLYKDVGGEKGYCYYGRADQDVRFFFADYKVTALYTICRICSRAAADACRTGKTYPAGNIGVDAQPADKSKPVTASDQSPVGKWQSVDFVYNIEDFKPGRRATKINLFLKDIEFKPDGTTSAVWTWSGNLLHNPADKTKEYFQIKEANGTTYLFFPWPDGQKLCYYVLKRVSGATPSKKTVAPSIATNQSPVGKWQSVDFVENINDFKPDQRATQIDLFLKSVELMPNGATSGGDSWKGGFIYAKDGKAKARFEIKKIDGSRYLFYPWLSGDVTVRGQKPWYYVLKEGGSAGPAAARKQPSVNIPRRQNSRTESGTGAGGLVKSHIVPTKRTGKVEWKDDKVVSRVLPYPDFTSLFIRLPIAHAAVDGNDVKVAVVGLSRDDSVKNAIEQVAPAAKLTVYTFSTSTSPSVLAEQIAKAANRIAVIPDADQWSEESIAELAKHLQSSKILVVIPSDLADEDESVKTINALHSIGVLTVGRVNRQSLVMQDGGDRQKPFNSRIRDIETDIFSTVGLGSEQLPTNPTVCAAGVAALVLDKWPLLTPAEVREKIVTGARKAWQATSIQTSQWGRPISVDPVTTKYTPGNKAVIFRFRVLDAAGAIGVDTEIPWFLNMLNVHKAWEITKGQGVLTIVSDQGFHIKHPTLVASIVNTAHFGPRTPDMPDQNFHGTDMARIFLSVAPQAKIIPVLCSPMDNRDELAGNIAKSFDYAVEQKADVVTASWAGYFRDYAAVVDAARRAVDKGVVISWFHYPQAYPGLLRSRFTYSGPTDEQCIGFVDRFLTDEPGFHPVEIEAGLSGTAPQAAGLAALAKSVNPQLKPADIEKLIFDNSTPIGDNIRIPDAYKIVLAAKQMIKTGK